MNNGYSICLNKWALDTSIKDELGLLLIISSLCANSGECFAKNEYFAKLFNVSDITISRKIKKLEEKKYIKIDYLKRGCEVIKRTITLTNFTINKNDNPQLTDLITDDYQNCKPTINKNVKDNNTIINNTIINNISVDNFSEENFSELEDLDKIEEEVIIEEKQTIKKVKQIDTDFLEFAKGLKSYVENKKRIKVSNSQLENWAKEIYKLYKQKLSCDTEEKAKERIKNAIQFLINYGETDKYYPVVESGRSSYEKFERVEDAMKRQKSKDFCGINFADLGWDLLKKKGEKNDK
jgi:hypothetical protein